MPCELCGNDGKLFKSMVEGVEMSVCRPCSRYGTQIRSPKIKKHKPRYKTEETNEVVVQNFSKLIKQKREEKGLKQQELARAIAERESVIHSLETGHSVPPIKLAKKLQRFLNVKLVELDTLDSEPVSKTESQSMTIGDLIKKN